MTEREMDKILDEAFRKVFGNKFIWENGDG
jgi:hypothetical protein